MSCHLVVEPCVWWAVRRSRRSVSSAMPMPVEVLNRRNLALALGLVGATGGRHTFEGSGILNFAKIQYMRTCFMPCLVTLFLYLITRSCGASSAACPGSDHPTPKLQPLSVGDPACISLDDVCIDQQQFVTCELRCMGTLWS